MVGTMKSKLARRAAKRIPYVGQAAIVAEAAPGVGRAMGAHWGRSQAAKETARRRMADKQYLKAIRGAVQDVYASNVQTSMDVVRAAAKAVANPEDIKALPPLTAESTPADIKSFRRAIVFHFHPDRLVARLGRQPTPEEVVDANLKVTQAMSADASIRDLNALLEQAIGPQIDILPRRVADLVLADQLGEGTFVNAVYEGIYHHPVSRVAAHVYRHKRIPGRKFYVSEQMGADGVTRRYAKQTEQGHEQWVAVTNPEPEILGTMHFDKRNAERFASRDDETRRKLLTTYLALKNRDARISALNGRYAVQFGGTPRGQGDYIVVEITGGIVSGFISLLSNQRVIMSNTTILQAKDIGINLKRERKPKENPVARRNPGAPELYQNVLAHLRAIHWIAWTAHWVASGPNYYGDHLLLQRLYSGDGGGPAIEPAIDTLGEKMVAHFGVESVNPALLGAKAQSLVQQAAEVSTGRFAALLALEQSLQTAIRTAWRANQESGDRMSLGVDDYLMGLANERETAIYLLMRRVGS